MTYYILTAEEIQEVFGYNPETDFDFATFKINEGCEYIYDTDSQVIAIARNGQRLGSYEMGAKEFAWATVMEALNMYALDVCEAQAEFANNAVQVTVSCDSQICTANGEEFLAWVQQVSDYVQQRTGCDGALIGDGTEYDFTKFYFIVSL